MASDNERMDEQIRRWVQGDLAARDWVVTRMTTWLLLFARQRLSPPLRSHLTAEDLVEETWLRLLSAGRIESFRLDEPAITPRFYEFVRTVFVREMARQVDRLRRRGRERRETSMVGSDDRSPIDAQARTVTGVATRISRDDEFRRVQEEIEKLGPVDREIVRLRFVDLLRNKKAAEVLGIDPTVAASRAYRALEKLRERFPGTYFDDELPE